MTTNTWDFENRLTKVALPNGSLNTFIYNGDNMRIQRQDSLGTLKQIWDGVRILEEVDQHNVSQAVYTLSPAVHGNMISQWRSGIGHYFLSDPLGSTTRLTDASQNVTDTYLYKAFGEVLLAGGTLNPFRYVGRLQYYCDGDFNGLYVLRRAYSPSTARWLSTDRSPFGSIIRGYQYGKNDPVNRNDPSGRNSSSNGHVPGHTIADCWAAYNGQMQVANAWLANCLKNAPTPIAKGFCANQWNTMVAYAVFMLGQCIDTSIEVQTLFAVAVGAAILAQLAQSYGPAVVGAAAAAIILLLVSGNLSPTLANPTLGVGGPGQSGGMSFGGSMGGGYSSPAPPQQTEGPFSIEVQGYTQEEFDELMNNNVLP